ncbi:phosphoribosylaminoimidazolesuccinocarboxamide synthase [Thermocrinis minervae]|uniref:Phosphoribosylaminoimidazole-succinocarboxamide synthase n=1 Tax=Thermocrinis minervae TaxID=381751 RepID=A0A1M6TGY2_9AQUI|nr:phosphoribosylaminoimidazolesuccinocarboxamide synthase [Thermocrinis minervae]SHK56028.1 phosphoribosylaminoimidazole-succinocarboxamide synthase [Thermocrinis minervae]
MQKLYEGKAKVVYLTQDPDKLILYFKDTATAFDATKKAEVQDKGVVNNTISSLLFELLNMSGIRTHFIQKLSDREMLVWKTERIDVEVVVRNIAAGSICKRLGLEEGKPIDPPLVEFFYKKDELHDPLICKDHILMLGLMKEEEVKHVKSVALKVNEILRKFFLEHRLILVDFKLEFGRKGEEIILIDEISPDTCRLWDAETKEKLDKDRFRFDLGDLMEGYKKVLERIKNE